jgi:hypothetical protein
VVVAASEHATSFGQPSSSAERSPLQASAASDMSLRAMSHGGAEDSDTLARRSRKRTLYERRMPTDAAGEIGSPLASSVEGDLPAAQAMTTGASRLRALAGVTGIVSHTHASNLCVNLVSVLRRANVSGLACWHPL